MPGAAPVVVLNGASAGAGANGLFIAAGNSIVKGLTIQGFSAYGIYLQTGAGINIRASVNRPG